MGAEAQKREGSFEAHLARAVSGSLRVHDPRRARSVADRARAASAGGVGYSAVAILVRECAASFGYAARTSVGWLLTF